MLSVALFYGATGNIHYDHISLSLASASFRAPTAALLFATLILKLGAAPLHHWAPDLYDNIPTSITLWMILIPKLALLGFILQISYQLQLLELLFIVTGSLSLIVGSIGLCGQWRIKRFIAYSAISHLGFLL